MAYFKINNMDFSQYVSELNIETNSYYNAQTNAAGDTVIDYINSKRTIEVGIIPLSAAAMVEIQAAIKPFGVFISFLNPATNTIEESVACYIPDNGVEYYTIQANKTSFKAFKLTFNEL